MDVDNKKDKNTDDKSHNNCGNANVEKRCLQCSDTFICMADNQQPCWCSELPLLIKARADSNCLCPHCLSARMKRLFEGYPERAKAYLAQRPKVKEEVKEIVKEKGVNDFKEGLDYYLNEDGNWVFTAFYHLKKGYCCQNACKHCPYGFEEIKP